MLKANKEIRITAARAQNILNDSYIFREQLRIHYFWHPYKDSMYK